MTGPELEQDPGIHPTSSVIDSELGARLDEFEDMPAFVERYDVTPE